MNMALLQEWRDYAYKFDDRTAEGQQFWLNYFNIEKGIYEQLLADKDTVVSGTVKELADKYETELQMFVGFLDGINDSKRACREVQPQCYGDDRILRWNQRQLKRSKPNRRDG